MPIESELTREVRKLVIQTTALLERYSRVAEEIDGIRLMLEEAREIFRDHFAENAAWADVISKRLDRVERYVILTHMVGTNKETLDIENVTGQEHLGRALRADLVEQRKLYDRYQRNINKVRESVANFGETVARANELEGYEAELAKIDVRITRIRTALTELDNAKTT